jgi:phosphatidylglycerophosphatase A
MKKEEILATCFGLGMLPFAPAVWGSLPPVVTYQVLGYLGPSANVSVMALFLITGSWICVKYAPTAIESLGSKRRSMVVADKLAGQGLTMLMIALLGPANICNSMALGFALFRVFDIAKPWPHRQLGRMPPGVNILAQALAEGFCAGIVAGIVILVFPVHFG